MTNEFLKIGPPVSGVRGVEYSVTFGLKAAVECLSECSPVQNEMKIKDRSKVRILDFGFSLFFFIKIMYFDKYINCINIY